MPYNNSQREEAAQLTHARVAQAAWELLSQMSSPSGFSMAALAEAAGVSRATVFACVGSKSGAIAAGFEHFSVAHNMADLTDVVNLASTEAATRAYCDAFVDFYAQHRAVVSRLRAYAALDATIGQAVQTRELRRRAGVGHLLARHAFDATITLPKVRLQSAVDRLAALFGFDVICSLLDSASSTPKAKRSFYSMVNAQINDSLTIDGGFH